MDLWKGLLISALKNEEFEFDKNDSIKEIVELQCYKLLNQIKRVLEDEFVGDLERHEIIKRVVKEFEKVCIYINKPELRKK